MTVKVYRLIGGEDIISDVEIDSKGYIFNNPAQIIMQQTQDGRVGAAFAPFAPYAKDNKVLIYKEFVIGEIELDVKMINEYNRIFGSGIIVASAAEMPQSIIQ
jgi:hypothetical protein